MVNQEVKKLTESVIDCSNSSNYGQSLDENGIFNSVQKINDSVMGGEPVIVSLSNTLTSMTKPKLEGVLNWLKMYADEKAIEANSALEVLIPFQLASIAATVAIFSWYIRNPAESALAFFAILVLALLVSILTSFRIRMSSNKNKFVKWSVGSKSLRKAVQDVDLSSQTKPSN